MQFVKLLIIKPFVLVHQNMLAFQKSNADYNQNYLNLNVFMIRTVQMTKHVSINNVEILVLTVTMLVEAMLYVKFKFIVQFVSAVMDSLETLRSLVSKSVAVQTPIVLQFMHASIVNVSIHARTRNAESTHNAAPITIIAPDVTVHHHSEAILRLDANVQNVHQIMIVCIILLVAMKDVKILVTADWELCAR
jgi:hypothetical protein